MDEIIRLRLDRNGLADRQALTPASLPMPDNQLNNFWYVENSSDTVFVFIHGIFSNSRSCWLYCDSRSGHRVFWPDLIRDDPRFNCPSIFLAGFDTQIDSGDFAIADCSTQVFNALERQNIDGPPVLGCRSIVFIGHSTGGIVARYVVERNQEMFREKAVGFVLLASPSLGSQWANLLSIFATICNQRLGLQLRRGSEILDELDGRFRDLVDRKAKLMPLLFGMEACENKLIFRDTILRWLLLLVPNRGKIVSKLSAGCYFGRVTEIPGTDHFSIVKPNGLNHPSHDFLVTFYSRFTTFLSESHHLQHATGNSHRLAGADATEPSEGLAAEIRRNLIAAKSINDLQICRAQAIAALAKHPVDPDFVLIREQVEEALSHETTVVYQARPEPRRSRTHPVAIGTAIALTIAVVFFFSIKRGPDLVINSVAKGASVSGDSEAIVSGTVSRAKSQKSIYVLYKSAPDMWTASKAQIAEGGIWTADLGRWNDVTSENSPNTAELSVVAMQKPLDEQGVATAGEGVFLIPSNRLREIAGEQFNSLKVAVKPIVSGETLRMNNPVSGSVVSGNEPFEVTGVATGNPGCVYVLHRTPQLGRWAAHAATVDADGHWRVNLSAWNDHPWIHEGVNELIAVALKPEYCSRAEDLTLTDSAVENDSLSKSPIVRIIVHK